MKNEINILKEKAATMEGAPPVMANPPLNVGKPLKMTFDRQINEYEIEISELKSKIETLEQAFEHK